MSAAQDAELQALRADIYALLASLFRQPPGQELLDLIASIELDPASNPGMYRGWQFLQLAARQANPRKAAQEYLPLFIGIGQGEVTPFASWYLTGSLMEAPLIELRKDLRLLGFERAEHAKEPEDHVAALCEIMAFLLEQGATPARQATFFNRHLAAWVQPLCQDIQKAPSAVFYQAVALLAQAFFEQESQLLPPPDTRTQAVQLFVP